MGFRVGAYATVFSANNLGRLSDANISISKKNQSTGNYEKEFSGGFVKFIGAAHNKLGGLSLPTREEYESGKRNNARIKILDCDVQNMYMKEENGERKATFNKSPQYIVYDFELSSGDGDSGNRKNQKPAPAPQKAKPAQGGVNEVDDDELPF